MHPAAISFADFRIAPTPVESMKVRKLISIVMGPPCDTACAIATFMRGTVAMSSSPLSENMCGPSALIPKSDIVALLRSLSRQPVKVSDVHDLPRRRRAAVSQSVMESSTFRRSPPRCERFHVVQLDDLHIASLLDNKRSLTCPSADGGNVDAGQFGGSFDRDRRVADDGKVSVVSHCATVGSMTDSPHRPLGSRFFGRWLGRLAVVPRTDGADRSEPRPLSVHPHEGTLRTSAGSSGDRAGDF